ncbi:hypothetical protein HRD49_18880 [Corallococcus exiguus]|uniref:Uncharacterized protein n=2 Tax=Corallococcus exiguus TaxID=83462 RepID=A0A7Y1S115_9BACT|nr:MULTISPECIES: hypothetical protein [Corallococcus]NBC41146.1 hypothetical protein [Corallococcus exiguus]NNC16118.1 hypothetical protein [Corallococcus exiguus]NRD53054.1 hypothetical protein [Corallococcus exiguus]NRD63817.1 hypothetical protein [Corallococcus exiguus]RKH31022.1 hypothetical protein D7V77_01385 [Corallococcus sp. CA041A]
MNFRLPSNAGHNMLEGKVRRAVSLDSEPCLLLELRSTGNCFRRDNHDFMEVVEDFDLRLPQVVVLRSHFDTLLRALRQWQVTQEPFSLDLDHGRDVTCTVEVRAHSDAASDRWKPDFTLVYASPKARIEVNFSVDASCLLEWTEGLEQAVAIPH